MASPKQKKGYTAEKKACAYLESQGLKLIERNFRIKSGEIDLIMREKEYLVFVEVRFRKSEDYETALESITAAKQRKVVRTAIHYLISKDCFEKVDCRFDVVAMNNRETHWIKNAFSAN